MFGARLSAILMVKQVEFCQHLACFLFGSLKMHFYFVSASVLEDLFAGESQ